MAKRIGVSIPDELHERAQKFKGQLNVSKVCQKALDTATKHMETKVVKDGDSDPVQRLINEMLEKNEDIIDDEAQNNAIIDANRISYNDLKEFKNDPENFYDEDPGKLHERFGDPHLETSSDIYESWHLMRYYYKTWAFRFCSRLQELCSGVFDGGK